MKTIVLFVAGVIRPDGYQEDDFTYEADQKEDLPRR